MYLLLSALHISASCCWNLGVGSSGKFHLFAQVDSVELDRKPKTKKSLMGFLEEGVPLKWEDTDEYYKILEYIRHNGALQVNFCLFKVIRLVFRSF